ncbi:MAG: serine protease of Rhomboid family [Bacillales bacterium]|nr:serine protease of Rhomboid family [Bacillales bacterium]
MNELKDKLLFLSTAKHLTEQEKFELIKAENEFSELWFKKQQDSKNTFVRVSIMDFLWKKDLQKDILLFHSKSHKYFNDKNEDTQYLNIYFCKSLPYEWNGDGPILYFRENNFHHILIEEGISHYELSSFLMGQVINTPISPIDNIEHEYDVIKRTLDNTRNRKKNYSNSIINYSKPFFTYVLLIVIVGVFFIVEKGDSTNINNLIDYGAKFNPLIIQGEWSRFITPIFLHIGITHLIMNSIALYFVGPDVEKIYGKVRFLIIFFISGILGVLASFIFSKGVSAGASGAIFGLFGALLYFSQRHSRILNKGYKLNIVGLVIANIIFGFTVDGIDQAAHIGGLVGGYLCSLAVRLPNDKRPALQSVTMISLSVIFAIGLSLGFKVNNNSSENLYLLSEYYVKKENYSKAYNLITENINKVENPNSELYFILGYVEVKQNNLADALDHFKMAVKLDEDNDTAYFNLALISLELRNVEEAYDYITKAEDINPEKKYSNLKNNIERLKREK